MIVHRLLYTAPKKFNTGDDFIEYTFGGYEKTISALWGKREEMMKEHKLLVSYPFFHDNQYQYEFIRLWVDENAKDEYLLHRRKVGDMVSFNRDLSIRNVKVRETFEEV